MKKAFSLLELLIVVVIIGLVYTLAVTSFPSAGASLQEKPSLTNIRAFLQKIPHEQSVSLLCLNECRSCMVFSDGKRVEEHDASFDGFLDTQVQLYRYTNRNGFEALEEKLHFIDENSYENVCFSYQVDVNGVGEELFVVYKEKVYDLTTMFQSNVYASLSEAQNAYKVFEMEVTR